MQVEIRYSQLIFAKTATSVGKKLTNSLNIFFDDVVVAADWILGIGRERKEKQHHG